MGISNDSPVTFIRVRWTDSAQYREPAKTKEVDDEILVMETAGWLVKETANLITVAQDYNAVAEHWRNIIAIPQVNVLKTWAMPLNDMPERLVEPIRLHAGASD